MVVYKRNIESKLLALRMVFALIVLTGFYSIIKHHAIVSYFVVSVFIFVSIIVVKELDVSFDSFNVTKYYFFGLIKRKWPFDNSENISILIILRF